MSAPAIEAPSGLVTFLFTDIEGSTRLFHRLGDRYVDLLERHRAILREACDANRGIEVSEEGDSMFVAFQSADDALQACARAQRELAAASWPDGVEVRVRMGLHTGMAWPHNHDYVAMAVHQAARVMAAAHGGQILLSEHTAGELHSLQGLKVDSLGRFRVRDFDEPLRLYQVRGSGLMREFPAVRAIPADGHNIVHPPTATIGRTEEIATIATGLAAGSLITLVGPGGVGKTRVAAEIGIRIASKWEDGVWLVDLAGIEDADLVAPAIAAAIGAPRLPDGERWADVLDHLRLRQAVVILDNCEHLLAVCRELIAPLLAQCPGVAVLATSREPIRLPAEVLRQIKPLPTPAAAAAGTEMVSSPSVRLFVDRAAAVRPGFAVDEIDAAVVADICRHLDGIPLFIELAAANVAVQSPAEILAGLEDRFRLLRSRDPLLSDRHRTVEGVLGWSYRLLGPDEQVAFRRLSVFGASFSLETAVAAVAVDAIEQADVPQLIWALVDRSLVTADLAANETRYRLLETMRSYGRRLLDESDETELTAESLAHFLLERLGPWLPASQQWVGDVSVELANLRSLVPTIHANRQELAQQIACTIGLYHDASHAFREGIEELTRYVDALQEPTATRSSLLSTLAYLHLRTGDVEAAERLVDAAGLLRDEYGAPEWDEVGVERTRGEVARREGNLSGSVEIARRALERQLGDRGRSRMFNLLGTASAALGDFTTAFDACSRELDLNRRLGYDEYIASAHGNLAEVAMRLGDVSTAAEHQQACLELATAQGSIPMVAFSLVVAARIAGARQDWATATRLQARAETMITDIGLALYHDDRQQIERLTAESRRTLGPKAFDRSVRAGHVLSIPEAVRLAGSVFAGAAAQG